MDVGPARPDMATAVPNGAKQRPPQQPAEDLAAKLRTLEASIRAVAESKANPGPAGPPGPPGERGPTGPGADGAKVDAAHDRAAKALAVAEGVASWLPWLLGGATTGAATPLLLLGLGLGRRLLAKRAAPVQTPAPPPAGVPPMAVPAPPPAVQAPVVNPPAPEVVTKYVEVEKPSAELQAVQEAMDELAKKFPGAVGTIEALKAYARQIRSGKHGG